MFISTLESAKTCWFLHSTVIWYLITTDFNVLFFQELFSKYENVNETNALTLRMEASIGESLIVVCLNWLM